MQQAKTRKTRRIQQVSATNLFGIFNHAIPLKTNDRITILHGPNGFGKTMMLKLLHALFGQSNYLLQIIPFDEFKVDFEDDTRLRVSKTSRLSKVTEKQHTPQRAMVFQAGGEE